MNQMPSDSRQENRNIKPIIVIGAGGLGREVKWLICRINQIENTWSIYGFVDDNIPAGTLIDGSVVLGPIKSLWNYPSTVYVVCAIANSQIRKKIISSLKCTDNICYPNLIDPSVIMSEDIRIGHGNIICAYTSMTIHVTIGHFNIINPQCAIGHDVLMNDFITVYPSASIAGSVEIESECELGTGMVIIQGKKIRKNSIIGAGSVVIHEIPPNCTAVGCPAHPIKFRKES